MISSEPIRRHIEVVRTARYFEIGDLHAPVDDLWFVLHGYGQSAREFAEPFNDYAAEGRLIVLPEALSRFYVSHEGPVIGACWMTKEDRKSDIRDYIRYLNALYQKVTDVSGARNTRLTVLGFSQGTATATRWLASGDVTADRLILWGGLPAEELITNEFAEAMNGARIQFVYGTQDKYVYPNRMGKMRKRIPEIDGDFDYVTFVGGHEIDRDTLAELFRG